MFKSHLTVRNVTAVAVGCGAVLGVRVTIVAIFTSQPLPVSPLREDRAGQCQTDTGNDKWNPHPNPFVCRLELGDRVTHTSKEQQPPANFEYVVFHSENRGLFG